MKKNMKKNLSQKNVALRDPSSVQAEYFRTVKNNLDLLHIGRPIRSLVITSPTQNNGKTLISSNLAATYAQYNKKTLLIDLDLRKPSMGDAFPESKQSLGLSGLLDANCEDTLKKMVVSINNDFSVLPVGRHFSLPHVTINSEELRQVIRQAKEQFEMVIIDAPPILSVTDALILGEQADGCLMVVKNNYTKKQELQKGNELLSVLKDKYLGIIYNAPR
ncbi:CpsD/CapB family tyrosine-protein kinase [Candidatus Enterococcus courvalinii]|uniref:Tyrosine-protein kinase CpsD n=1 Tax=Candidatus Enterococcus courvalinii TaxID=2815329 RepID=A0ABS3HX17_9ENTE|nr:CpsD/CapB family tyrosine-protein kinase [Enterococcus sp. MSG2901]MBO0481022.1 CpsD/CapB family tyrosine-protein kinase [Enterococcus sp. MSG2901]